MKPIGIIPNLVFLHIPKTAGQSFRLIAMRQYPPRQRLPISYNHDYQFARLYNLGDEERRHIRLIFGHVYFGVHAYFQQPFTYITFLRDPVEQAFSQYYYSKITPKVEYFRIANQLTLEDFFKHRYETMGFTEQNIRQITAYHGFEEGIHRKESMVYKPLPAEALDIAKQNILNHFGGVGITEHFDESLILFQKAGLLKNIYYYRENVNKHRPKAKIPDSVKQMIRDYNPLDMQLYEWAKDQFEQRWQALGPQRDEILEKFRANNRYWSAYYNVIDEIADTPAKLRSFKANFIKRLQAKSS